MHTTMVEETAAHMRVKNHAYPRHSACRMNTDDKLHAHVMCMGPNQQANLDVSLLKPPGSVGVARQYASSRHRGAAVFRAPRAIRNGIKSYGESILERAHKRLAACVRYDGIVRAMPRVWLVQRGWATVVALFREKAPAWCRTCPRMRAVPATAGSPTTTHTNTSIADVHDSLLLLLL